MSVSMVFLRGATHCTKIHMQGLAAIWLHVLLAPVVLNGKLHECLIFKFVFQALRALSTRLHRWL
jgi:hypothetical protein